MKTKFLTVFLTILTTSLNPVFSDTQIKYAGARSSYYGISPFPTEAQWGNVNLNMAAQFEGSQPTAVWIVGGIRFSDTGDYCKLEFPSPGGEYNHISFYPDNNDKHESYLTHFDSTGVKAFLQVESGDAEILELIDLVLTQYGHHECVVGFGVDVEWYLYSQNSEGVQVTDALAEQWENKVKSYKSTYTLFLKHYNPKWMPPNYRGDIVFLNDSQQFDHLLHMAGEFAKWAGNFLENIVMFQVGYPRDYPWWKELSNPPKDIGETIAAELYDPNQEIGIVWVDFTLDEPEMLFLFEEVIEIKNIIASPQNNPSLSIEKQLNTVVLIQYTINGYSNNSTLNIYTPNGSMAESYILNCHSGKIYWPVATCASGTYFINLRNQGSSITQKAVLIKR